MQECQLHKSPKKTMLNKDVVRYRINNLEKEKIIEGYYTVLNIHKLGFIITRMYLDLISTNPKIKHNIIKHLDKNFKANFIFTIDGEYQLGIISYEKSINTLYKKLQSLKNNYGNHINKEQISFFINLNHYPKKFIHEDHPKEISIYNEEKYQIKKDELLILKEISNNARISSVELSTKLKIPQTTIINKLKKLEKDRIILGYRAKINTEKLGYENYFLEVYIKKSKEIEHIEFFAKSNENCIYSEKCINGADIEIETEFQNKKEFLKFLDKFQTQFPSIKKIKYWSTLEYNKIDYFPEILNITNSNT